MDQVHNATLVVIEYGGSWPRWLHPSQSGDMAVVAQHYPGAPSSLVTQVASRVTRLENMGWHLRQMVVVSNGKTDKDLSAARSVLARGLIAHLRDIRRGELILTCVEPASTRAPRELIALASALESTALGTGVSLSVRGWDGSVLLTTADPRVDVALLAQAS